MIPHITQLGKATSGIARVVEGYFKYLPEFGVELVASDCEDFDLDAVHAGSTGAQITGCCHSHGTYWTSDYDAADWEWKTNVKVIQAMRHAKVITVPSEWVAESARRDMHLNPWVIPHGIDAEDWTHNYSPEPYVLWNKNRTGDVCDIDPLTFLASRFSNMPFLSTFSPETDLANITSTGVVSPQEMKGMVQRTNVYLATTKETFGIGMLEAMASGVPVLAYAYGGALDIIEHGVNGYLAPPGDLNALAEGLDYCIRHRATLGANGRELVKKWNWRDACALVAKAYEAALVPSPPTAAIIIPSYNYAHLVGGAIQSAIDQLYPHLLDIIVVDDGTDDGGETRRVTERFEDSRVRYVRQPNAGVANARNMGISLTDAKYICCLDADDSIAPMFLDVLIPPMEADPSLGITYSALMLVSHQGDDMTPAGWPHECDFNKQLTGDNQVPTCCVFRREAWRRLGGYRQRYSPHGCGTEDAEFWLRIGSAGFGIEQATKEPLFFYRMGGSTTSGKMKGAEWLTWHPYTYDRQHPFASIATPMRYSHPVRQYDEPVISVIIPVGPGHEHHVIDALDSVEAQTLRKWEAIVVWDTPEPPHALESYPFVRARFTDGGLGAGFSRNVGAEMARAPFLVFLDADDYLYPNALSSMLVAFGEGPEEGSIVFSDSQGEMVIDALAAKQFDQRGELISYDARTELAVIANRPNPYDYDKAVYQPDPKSPYFWCYISSLTPKLWHDNIGGFDEDLPAWEDWDYWMRMARAGYAFTLVQEPLLVYRYYSGSRREIGRGIKKDLMDHLVDKFKEVDVMACRGCRGRREPRVPTRTPPRSNTEGVIMDEDVVLVKYTHPNRGQHRVIGPRSKRVYGHRGGGDQFYVLRIDMESMPQWFKEIRETPRPVVVAPERSVMAEPPAPKPIVKPVPPLKVAKTIQDTGEAVTEVVPEQTHDEFLAQIRDAVREDEEPTVEVLPTRPPATIDTLPGISPQVATALKVNGIVTPAQLIALGEKDFQAYKGIGPARAEAIISAAQAYVAELEAAP